ncbi:MAG: cytochrome c-type biogenesis protein [Beijerinckiaceae bacterium]
MKTLARIAAVFLMVSTAHAVQPDEILKDPAQEARARALSSELRCLVCQNQSIDDSDAPLARDLRVLVRERIAAGDSNAQVKSFLVQRYGEFVLLKPPLSLSTVFLWAAPALLFVIGLIAIARARRQHAPALLGQAGLTDAEKAALADRLKDSAS